MKHLLKYLFIGSVFTISNYSAFSQLQPSKYFGSGMVLQRGRPIKVWGIANVGDTISVVFQGERAFAISNSGGRWECMLPAFPAGGPYLMTISDGSSQLTYSDIYTGDVWFCAGQSNMEMTLKQTENASVEIATANYTTIREFNVGNNMSNQPLNDITSGYWKSAVGSDAGNFSGVAYYFSKHLQPHIDGIAIGIVNCSIGGSRIEAWLGMQQLGYDYNDIVLAQGEPERQPTLIYNAMLHPLAGLSVKGFIWYQGESNADNFEDAEVYAYQFQTLITEWRNLWNCDTLPFIWVQLPNQGYAANENSPSGNNPWSVLRESQSKALSLSNTAEIVTIDVGDLNIHPKDKKSVGERLALAIRKLVYNENIVASGPQYKSYTKREDGSIQIDFKNIGDGLVARETTDSTFKWFSCSDGSSAYHKAHAEIEGNSVIVSCASVNEIKKVRYAWEYNPAGVNFYNENGLPVAPFKIDIHSHQFAIENFSASSTTIERGEFATLQWKVTEASYVELNGSPVDSSLKQNLFLLDTSVFVLKAVNKDNIYDTLTETIIINVTNPLPRIRVYAPKGNISNSNNPVDLNVSAKAPGRGTLTLIELFINNELYETFTEPPFETSWQPTALGEYTITSRATDLLNSSKISEPYVITITDLPIIRYEAEHAVLTGEYSKKYDENASNRRCIEVHQNWTMTYTVNVPASGVYVASIRYKLNFESPKEQILYVNGINKGNYRFETTDITNWNENIISFPFNAGENTIQFENSSGWMTFDYLDVLGAEEPISSLAETDESISITLFDNKIEINTDYSFHYNLKVYDNLGKVIDEPFSGILDTGYNEIPFYKGQIVSGTYFIKIVNKENGTITTQKVMIK